MREIIITANDSGRRLDRFLRKYLPGASLSEVYKTIRKDVKVDGRRRNESYILNEGEVLALYLKDEDLSRYGAAGGTADGMERGGASGGSGRFGAAGADAEAALAGGGPPARHGKSNGRAKRTFGIVHEDESVLIVSKPFGLLTHGDSQEKKDHLANQVKDYLIETGAFDPRNEKVFVPAPVNRLDRNTTGVVLFGKTSEAMRELNRMIREDDIRKFYMTIACGVIEKELRLGGSLVKDEAANKVKITDGEDGKDVETIVRPLEVLTFGSGLKATLCEVELVTGRSHQIRAHLASAGHPLIGDSKYATKGAGAVNNYIRAHSGLTTQLLHADRIEFLDSAAESESLGYLAGRAFDAPVPKRFREIFSGLGGKYIY